MTNTRALVLIAVSVVLVRCVVFLVYPEDGPHVQGRNPDGWLKVAHNVMRGHGFVLDDSNPTARRGPTVIYFFAVVLWLGGDSLWSIIIAQWLADIGTAILLFFITYEIFHDRRVAVFASLLFALYGSGLVYTFRAWSEPVSTLALAGFTWSLLRALRQPSHWRFALCGGLLGLTVLARPVMQFYPLVVLPLMWWTLARPWRQVLSRFAVFCVIFAAVLLPWVVRNYLVFQAFIPGASHGGHALYQGHFTLDQPDYLRYRTVQSSHPALRQVLEARFGPAPEHPELYHYARAKGLNEYEVNRIAFQEAIKAILAFPDRYVVASLVRCARLWLGSRFVALLMGRGSPWGYLVAAANGALLGLAVAGVVCFRGAWLRSAVPLMVLLAYTTAIYMVTFAVARYSVPVMPYVMVFAAQTMVSLLPSRGTAKNISPEHIS